MHELSIALSLLDEVAKVAEREHASAVSEVRLKVGRLSGVAPDALRFAWELARVDTVAASASLHIEDIDVIVFCSGCDAERAPLATAELVCGVCGTISPRVVSGRELRLVGVAVG